MQFVSPTLDCKCKEILKIKYLEYKKPPPSEINLGLDLKNYNRLFYKCIKCKHLFAFHKKFNNKNLYSGKYIEQTYGNIKDVKRNFLRIRAIPKKKSDNYKRCNRIEKLIKFNKKFKILDVGSGLGVFPYELKKRGYQIICNDPDKSCQKFIQKDLKLKCISKSFLKFKLKKKFNLITFNKVLEHLENPKQFIIKAKSILKIKGYLYIEVPDILAINDKIGKNREEFLMGHFHVFSKKSLKILLQSCGFKIINLKSIRDPSGKYTIYAFVSLVK